LVCNWGLQILDALIYLHEQDPPVVHRDIKPANIKLTPDNRIKLVDFGLVKLLAADEMRTITVIQGRGTALYTPLEQYGGELDHTDGRSDLYALGATLYTLLMGYPPLSAKDRFLHPNGLEPPHQVNPEISATVSEAIMWAMAMHPDQRPQTARILQQALLGRTRPPQLTRPLTPFRTAEALAANRYLLLACALLLLIALLGIFST
jgi:serine/threonine-protein kinase